MFDNIVSHEILYKNAYDEIFHISVYYKIYPDR